MSNGIPVALIEAKKLGVKLDAAQAQIIRYTKDPKCSEVQLIAFTNGDEWAFWREERGWELETARIQGDTSFKTAYDMVNFLARANFRNDVNRPAAPSAPAVGGWYPLGSPMPTGRNAPTAIRCGGGSGQAVKYWLDTHLAVARHLFATGALTRAMVPVRSPRGDRYLVNDSPYHADGNRFRNEKEFASGLWLDGSGGARWTLRESAELMEACGVDPSTVQVRFD